MKKYFFLLLVILVSLAFNVYAADDIYNDGKWKIDSDGIFRPVDVTAAGQRGACEVHYTSDTLTAADSGKTFISIAATELTFTLPAAKQGMWFRFVANSTQTIKIDPATTESIVYTSSSAGKKLILPGLNQGETVTLFCPKDGNLFVESANGTLQIGD